MTYKIQEVSQIDSPNLAIFVQGSWAPWNNEFHIAVRDALLKAKISSTVMYDSERDWEALKTVSTRKEWIAAFDGKTYQDQLVALRDVIEHINIEYTPENLYLVARSYGGGLAALVCGDGIPNLTKAVLSAPQISIPHSENLPNIYQNFPATEHFLVAVNQFEGELTLIHGLYDIRRDNIPTEGDVLTVENVLMSMEIPMFLLDKAQHAKLLILKQGHKPLANDKKTISPQYIQAHIDALR